MTALLVFVKADVESVHFSNTYNKCDNKNLFHCTPGYD